MACGGRYKFNAMSQFVDEDLCLSFRSLPPKEGIVAVVSKDILSVLGPGRVCEIGCWREHEMPQPNRKIDKRIV